MTAVGGILAGSRRPVCNYCIEDDADQDRLEIHDGIAQNPRIGRATMPRPSMRSVLPSMTFTFDPAHDPENRDRFSDRIVRQSMWYSVLCAPKRGARRCTRISKKDHQS